MGRNWVHAALAVESRFPIDLRLGPRTLETAVAMVATVAACCLGVLPRPLLLLVDGHLPYPAAILRVFGVVRHGRRRNGRGRPKRPRLKGLGQMLVEVAKTQEQPAPAAVRSDAPAVVAPIAPAYQPISEESFTTMERDGQQLTHRPWTMPPAVAGK